MTTPQTNALRSYPRRPSLEARDAEEARQPSRQSRWRPEEVPLPRPRFLERRLQAARKLPPSAGTIGRSCPRVRIVPLGALSCGLGGQSWLQAGGRSRLGDCSIPVVNLLDKMLYVAAKHCPISIVSYALLGGPSIGGFASILIDANRRCGYHEPFRFCHRLRCPLAPVRIIVGSSMRL